MAELTPVDISMTEDRLQSPEQHHGGWMQRLTAFRERPLGRFTSAMAISVALAANSPYLSQQEARITTSAEIVEAQHQPARMDLVLGASDGRATLHLDDWETATSLPQTQPAAIELNPTLQQIAMTQEPFTNELALTPPNIEDQAAFSGWVGQQAHRADLWKALDVTTDTDLTPHKLVDLAASIVIANVNYNLGTIDEIKAGYRQPMDKNLQEGNPLQCEGYAAATFAVFSELKKLYPEKLQNTYMTTQSGLEEGHVWNLVMQVEAPSEASVAFLDATADDPSYYGTGQPPIHVAFVELAEGLYTKQIIDTPAFRALVAQYQSKNEPSAKEQEELAEDELYL